MGKQERVPVLVRGVGDVGSAVAAVLFHAGYRVALHDEPEPTTPRRGMAFTDAVFDGVAVLDGLTARRVENPLAMPKTAEPWSLTSLREKLIKIGAKVISHGRYVTFQMAEVAEPKQMYREILSLIIRLRAPPAPA
jgi:hypothetical protein